MKKIYALYTALLIMLLSVSSFAQQPTEEQMKAYQELNTPGEEHAMIAKGEGKWTFTMKAFMPGMEGMTSTAEAEAKMILGGRFLLTTSKGEFMGQMVETHTIVGYDKRLKKFTMDGYDTMGTYGVHASGDYDPEKRTITYKGKNYEPMMDAYVDYTFTYHDKGDDEFIMDLVFHFPQGDMKIMESHAKRVK